MIKDAAKTHGLDGTLVAPDWPPLALDEVRAVLAQFAGYDEPIAILTRSPRPFSAAGVVRVGGRRVFVKRHAHAVRDAESLREEHRFMEYLRARGGAVPRVLQSESGETAIVRGGWTYEVHETPPGIDLYEDAISWTPFRSAEHARAAGQALARLHHAAERFDASARAARPLVSSFTIFANKDAEDGMKRYLASRPGLAEDAATRADCDRALELLAPFHAELSPLLEELPPLWTHNDLHASNLFWSDESPAATVTAVIDFGLADRTCAAHDLAIAIERNAVEWLTLMQSPEAMDDVAVHYDHLQALLAGYEAERALSTAEAHVLAPMLALCHAEFALTEADYFLTALGSREKARTASHDYLVGHARWFQSRRGTELLNWVRAWAEKREGSKAEASAR